MNFAAVVRKARQQLALVESEQLPNPDPIPVGGDLIYGRVCTTLGTDPPLNLSSDSERKSVFVFGPDAVEELILKKSTYDILCSIGRDQDYLYHMACEITQFMLGLYTNFNNYGEGLG